MPKKKKSQENQNGNAPRDYSHLPRARDFKLPKNIVRIKRVNGSDTRSHGSIAA
ncbi:MAG: hypothetical protein LH472_04530 [Pyrinomonadaceae bacterium]|nr:hypothetical protein [Pyrinomonadaceae bacterium]